MTPKEIEEKLKYLSDLQDLIKSKVEEYNRVSNDVDNSQRIGLLFASSEKENYDEDQDDEDEDSDEEDSDRKSVLTMSHDDFVKSRTYDKPYASSYFPLASWWFPSGINC